VQPLWVMALADRGRADDVAKDHGHRLARFA
jgi:hypothetical protein